MTGVVTGEAIPKCPVALPYGLTALPVASDQVTGRTDRHKWSDSVFLTILNKVLSDI